jgi:ATP-dependent Clp protease ATP-binding subunit ClpA
MRAAAGLKGRIFERVQVSVERARAAMAPAALAAERLPYSVEIPFSGTTKQALLTATGEADRLGHEGIGIAHLLLGLIEQKASVASSLLTGWGMSLQGVREDIVQLLDEESA